MAEYENFQDYQTNLENNIELRKAMTKLEDLLAKKHAENENLFKMHQDFKILHEKMRKECGELNQKLIVSYGEKSMTEKKYEAEISRLKNVYKIIINNLL
jgi:hypothetical protein